MLVQEQLLCHLSEHDLASATEQVDIYSFHQSKRMFSPAALVHLRLMRSHAAYVSRLGYSSFLVQKQRSSELLNVLVDS